jgi:hypothetical protein
LTPIPAPIAFGLYYRLKSESPPPSPQPGITWGIALASAILFAAVTFLIGRRYAFSGRQLLRWCAVGFMGGPLGAVLLLSVREWPAREACPSCGRMRVVNRQQCEHCAATFDPPLPDGTEVFEVNPV